jgi:hypothetical protein
MRGSAMSVRAGLVLGILMFACGAASAHGARPQAIRAVEPVGGGAALEAGLVAVAARGASVGEQAPSREELFSLLVFISLRNDKGQEPGSLRQ